MKTCCYRSYFCCFRVSYRSTVFTLMSARRLFFIHCNAILCFWPMLSLIFNRRGALSSRGAHSSKYGKQKKKIDEDAVPTNFCFSKEKKRKKTTIKIGERFESGRLFTAPVKHFALVHSLNTFKKIALTPSDLMLCLTLILE